MNAVIVGATSGMGRSIARQLAARGERIAVLGIPESELAATAEDLRQRGAKEVITAVCDLSDPASFAPALEAAWAAFTRVDAFILTAGVFATQDQLEADVDRARNLLVINFAHTVVLCEHARKRLLGQGGGGTLCVFSSVAGDRGRKPVAIYGSSKAGLSHYLESLDHKFRSQGLVVVTVKPGFVKTSMTTGLKPPPFAGEPDDVAARVIRAIEGQRPVVYAPFMWRWIMLVIRSLPRFVMRRINF